MYIIKLRKSVLQTPTLCKHTMKQTLNPSDQTDLPTLLYIILTDLSLSSLISEESISRWQKLKVLQIIYVNWTLMNGRYNYSYSTVPWFPPAHKGHLICQCHWHRVFLKMFMKTSLTARCIFCMFCTCGRNFLFLNKSHIHHPPAEILAYTINWN